MQADQLRDLYLDYFEARGHKRLPSASLVPHDPTLLFTSAGMVQFKDIFWGRMEPPFSKVVTCQKCFRATDIEKVGKTAFHHTFFEMLGNFSFGDYFKQGAIELAWAFVIEELSIPEERIWASVYEEDDDAYEIWKDVIGLPSERIVRLGKEHNWWGPVGDTGPCGPDSEIFFDAGKDKACGPDCLGPACECGRFSEIWNLVFMEHEAKEDGQFSPLKRKNIDTGMGLERTAAVLQGVESDYEIDLFRPIVEAIEAQMPDEITSETLTFRNLVADHIRGVVALLADGVLPGNEKQGYVLRRILRRAIDAGEKLGLPAGSLVALIDPVLDTLGGTYPEIVQARSLAEKVIEREGEMFRRTVQAGKRRLEEILDRLQEKGERTLSGAIAFELYDTYGFPLEMTEEIARETGIATDKDAFQKAMSEQKKRSRVSISARTSVKAEPTVIKAWQRPTKFLGYKKTEANGKVIKTLPDDDEIKQLVFDQTPFYAEAGGQIADLGVIENLTQPGKASVVDVRKHEFGAFIHEIELIEGTFSIGDRCRLIVDAKRRKRIARNHTATHLLHRALRDVLGEHVIQSGSYVSDEELRFDFSHFEKLTEDEIAKVEDAANAIVLENLSVKTEEMTLDGAKASGAMAHFEEEYKGKEHVRVISVGDFSCELCGGTHVRRSGEVGLIKIISEESIASGTRRIRAVTGDNTLVRLREQETFLAQLRGELGDDPLAGLARLRDQIKDLRDRVGEMTQGVLERQVDALLASKEKIAGFSLISGRVDRTADEVKTLADLLEERVRPAVVLLVGDIGGQAVVVCKVSKGIDAIDAGALVRELSGLVGGGGGGNRSFAQGGGPDLTRLEQALSRGLASVRTALAA